MTAIEGTIAASAHQSHAYRDGGCLYFTFAGQPAARGGTRRRDLLPPGLGRRDGRDHAAGGALSHHHGVGSTGAATCGAISAGLSTC